MLVNADFRLPAVIPPGTYPWVPSPQAGVERVMLDRVGGEVARATSMVRYAPRSFFPRHEHPGGEEILVLSGVFSDDTGDHPAGCYLRNPPGSAHRPSSTTGAVIFVKLGQMQPLESTARRIDTHQPANWSGEGEHAVCSLYSDPFEHVWLQRMPPGQPMGVAPTAGIELLVLDGALRDGSQQHGRGTWLRFPERLTPALHAGRAGAVVWVKATPTGASAL